jgi:hypothetical protein
MDSPKIKKADELFRLQVNENKQFPLNLEFSCLPIEDEIIFQNRGIFALYYREELIYIGYSNNTDDVRTTRFVRQLQSITFRGECVQLNNACINIIPSLVNISKDFKYNSFTPTGIDYVTSVNRLKFSEAHWDEFSHLENGFLKFFKFEWYVIEEDENLENTARKLKQKYQPRCNQEYGLPNGGIIPTLNYKKVNQ